MATPQVNMNAMPPEVPEPRRRSGSICLIVALLFGILLLEGVVLFNVEPKWRASGTMRYVEWCPHTDADLVFYRNGKFFVLEISTTTTIVRDDHFSLELQGRDDYGLHMIDTFESDYNHEGMPPRNHTFHVTNTEGIAFDYYVFSSTAPMFTCFDEVNVKFIASY